ncbi:phosphate ABC transporter substrate-binding protein [Eubacterium limosum]|uniref:Phosphate-binding protein n=1 Tax=Eubacterium limosum TaxID=1736 RepID=A0ABT5UQ33_EUBLI|nr:phosphate ABC transporter substrate-binding protein [Eubacterium limosum]MCB6569867.1 phosphate ABC transporter substrate-binding protein [Eubacterium limosum]MDE1471045.1 phosphate ABC transporter substrate-binding protein [Eubacterium limosum]
MKRYLSWIAALTVLILLSFSFSGCGNEELPAYSSEISGEINGGGSTSVQKIIDAEGAEFGALHPAVKFTYSGTGSSDGIKNAANGTYSFGCASRELKESEKTDLTELVFAYDGIAVIVNDENPVEDLTKDQIKAIYTGKITNWKEVGGEDRPIAVVSREDGAGTRTAVEELLDFTEQLKPSATVKEGNGNVQSTVSANPNAIGYVSITFVDRSVKPLRVDGVEATMENVLNESYGLSRPFLALYNEKNLTPQTRAFLDFIMTDEGQTIVEKNGGISVR